MRICAICSKKAIMGGTRIKTRGHYNPQDKKKKFPNLQKFSFPSGLRVMACTRCIKSYAKKTTAVK